MSITPLTLYGNGAASATLPSASTTWTATGSTNTRGANGTVGTNTGYMEAQSTAAYTPAFNANGPAAIPSGKGFLHDVTTLEGQFFDVGNWTPTIRLAVNDTSTLTADLICRFFVYHSTSGSAGSKYTLIGAVTRTGVTINNVFTTFALPAAQLPGVGFFPGDKLYMEWWVNVKTSTGSSGTTQLQMGDVSTLGGGAAGNQYVTPGYQPMAANVATTAFVSRSGQQFMLGGAPLKYVGFNSYDLSVRDAPPNGPGILTPTLQLDRCRQIAALGAKVVRMWAFGETTSATPVTNYFQYGSTGGQWNEQAFVQLDNAVYAASQAGLKLILCLVNQWSGYHGYKGTYVQWYNTANSTSLTDDNFHDTPGIIAMFQAFIKKLLTRVNTVSGLAYNADPAIFGWECINEGRYTTITDSNFNTVQSPRVVGMTSWYGLISSYIKALDGSHLVGTGGISQAADFVSGDGFHNGTFYGLDLLTQSQLPAIDWVDYHLYPVTGSEPGPGSFIFTGPTQYHTDLGQIGGYKATAGKPVVMNEVGDNRLVTDNTKYPLLFPRDRYYHDLFNESFNTDGMSGILLWNYGADDYFGYATGDPPPSGTPWQNAPDTPVFSLVTLWNSILNVTPATTPAAVAQACDAIAAHIAARNQGVLPDGDRQLTVGKIVAGGRTDLFPAFAQSLYNEYVTLDAATPTSLYTLLLDQWYNACQALDTATGGLQVYLQANSLQVAPAFLDAFNRYIAVKGSGTALAAWQAFGPPGLTIGLCAAGVFQSASGVPAAYGNVPLALVVAGGQSVGTNSVTYTVTYNGYNASGTLLTGLTASVSVPAGSKASATFALGVSGVAVTGIAATSGTPLRGDLVACVAQPARIVQF